MAEVVSAPEEYDKENETQHRRIIADSINELESRLNSISGSSDIAFSALLERRKLMNIRTEIFSSAGNIIPITNVTATPYNHADSDDLIICVVTAASVVNLLTAVGRKGHTLTIKNSAASTANEVITPAGAETIDGAATLALIPGASAVIVSDGANWHTV